MNIRYKVVCALLGICMSCDLGYAVPQARKNKPNIIYILTNHLGLSDLGCYGPSAIETPHIDALAKDGMIFTNYYSGHVTSNASNCSLLTGLHSGHACLRGTDNMPERGDVWNYRAMLADSTLEGQRPMPANTVTVSRKLQEAGYTTAYLGVWGLGYPGSASTPDQMGFDFFYGYNCNRQAHTYYPPFLYRNGHREYLNNQLLAPDVQLDRNADPYDERNYKRFRQEDYAPDLIYGELQNFIGQHREKPFALFWTTSVPHAPLQAPEQWVDHYRQIMGNETPYLGQNGYIPCRYPQATYAAMVSYLDEQIGGLVENLKACGLYDRTLIIFTSMGGWEGDIVNHPSASEQTSVRDNHQNVLLREENIRIPMIACWPEKIDAGTRCDLLSAFWDTMPTLCDLADVEAPPTDGVSMLPTLIGKNRRQKKHDFLYWEYAQNGGQIAVRLGKWKAIVDRLHAGNRQVCLYDLSSDSGEQCDVAAEHPDIVKDVLQIIQNEHHDSEVRLFSLPRW